MSPFIRGWAGLLVLPFIFFSAAAAQDVNNDGRFDCLDVDLIGMAAQSSSQDLTFDIDGSGDVDLHDVGAAMEYAGFPDADTNFDGVVDRVDMNSFGAHWQVPARGHCQGDFNYDGIVDASDMGLLGLMWQYASPGSSSNVRAADVTLRDLPSKSQAWRSGGFVLAEAGPFELVATPQRAPEGLMATSLTVRTKDPSHRIVTLDQVEITGAAHQVFLPSFFSPGGVPTPSGVHLLLDDVAGIGRWNQADTQLLIQAGMVGAGGGTGFVGIEEENDLSDPIGLQPTVEGFPMLAGIGPLKMGFSTDAFFLWGEYQANVVELARFVTPADPRGESDGVFLKVGIQGSDAGRNPLPFGDVIGLDNALKIPFFALPCDFDSDGFCDQQDLDRLNVAVAHGDTDPLLNLDSSDPPLITAADVTAWHNLSEPILGDTDYDGDVDSADLNNLALNWQINTARRNGLFHLTSWEGGDFDANSNVDAADLNQLGINWLRGVDSAGAAVPEPSGCVSLVLGLVVVLYGRRSRTWQQANSWSTLATASN